MEDIMGSIHYRIAHLYSIQKSLENCMTALDMLRPLATSRREEDRLTATVGLLVDARADVEKMRVELETGEAFE